VCAAGDFQAPSPAGNSYSYTGERSCPPSGSEFAAVGSYPCGTCFELDNGNSGSYSCDSLHIYIQSYSGAGCSGARLDNYPIQYLGCAASFYEVTVTDCNSGNGTSGLKQEQLSTEMKALPAAIQFVRDEALSIVKEALTAAAAAALAKI